MKHTNAPQMNRILVLLLGLACWLTAGMAPAALTDPSQIQTEAYVNLVQADQSLDAGRLDEALSQYQLARSYYVQLAKDFPGWETRVIQYRKTYCDNQIADVQHRKAGGRQPLEEQPELAPEPDPAPPQPARKPAAQIVMPPAPESAPVAEQAVEIDYLKSRVASLEAELAEFDTLQRATEAVQAQNAQLNKDIEAAQQQLRECANREPPALDELRSELAGKDEQLNALQKEIEDKKQADQALNDMEGKVNELRAENDRLKQEIKTLDGEIADAEVRANQAGAKLKNANQDLQQARNQQARAERELAVHQRKPIGEKLTRENEKAASTQQAQAAPEPKAKPEEKPGEKAKAEPKSGSAAAPVKATVLPKPIPAGMSAADYVRQLLQEGDNDSALATVRQARTAAPTDMNLTLIEGITLIRLQHYSEAATLLIDLAKNNPRHAEIHATLGAALMGAGFYEEARETLLMAIKLDRNLPECNYNLAQLYAFIDPVDLKLARKFYQQARNLGLATDPHLEKALN